MEEYQDQDAVQQNVTRSDKTGLIAERIIVQYAYNKFWGKLRLAHLHEDIFLPCHLAKFQCYSTLQGRVMRRSFHPSRFFLRIKCGAGQITDL